MWFCFLSITSNQPNSEKCVWITITIQNKSLSLFYLRVSSELDLRITAKLMNLKPVVNNRAWVRAHSLEVPLVNQGYRKVRTTTIFQYFYCEVTFLRWLFLERHFSFLCSAVET